jgi:hypothetical protein
MVARGYVEGGVTQIPDWTAPERAFGGRGE